jgi:6-pyruvoyltetrahydropterin/6-carboxytetrahydropterin synthase
LKHRTKAITDELDHRMMLPTRNAQIAVEEGPRSVHVRYRDREWLFPRDDCVLLPIENTTAELLARYIAHRLAEDLRRQYRYVPQVLRVEVEESFGQSATCEWRPS